MKPDVLQLAAELSDRGQPFVLATVVWRRAPSSGKEGATALITADGTVRGWLGGACAEPTVVREALKALEEGSPRLLFLGPPEELAAGRVTASSPCRSRVRAKEHWRSTWNPSSTASRRPCWSTASTARTTRARSPISRAKEEIDRIAALVRTAIGFDAKRGDQVEVVNLRFAETPAIPISEPAGWMSYLQFTKDDIMRGAEKGVMVLLGLHRPVDGGAPAGAPHRDAGRRSRAPAAGSAAAAAVAGTGRVLPRRRPASPRGRQHHHDGGANISIVGGDERSPSRTAPRR